MSAAAPSSSERSTLRFSSFGEMIVVARSSIYLGGFGSTQAAVPSCASLGSSGVARGENVSTTDGPASMVEPRRGARARKPSGRVTGPEWVQAFADASLASAV